MPRNSTSSTRDIEVFFAVGILCAILVVAIFLHMPDLSLSIPAPSTMAPNSQHTKSHIHAIDKSLSCQPSTMYDASWRYARYTRVRCLDVLIPSSSAWAGRSNPPLFPIFPGTSSVGRKWGNRRPNSVGFVMVPGSCPRLTRCPNALLTTPSPFVLLLFVVVARRH